jgi:hypothetical protein
LSMWKSPSSPYPKWQDKLAQPWRTCLFLFTHSWELCTKICGKTEVQSAIWATALSTMAMHLLTLLSLCMKFGLKTKWMSFLLFMPCLRNGIFQFSS